MADQPLITVQNVGLDYTTKTGTVKALEDVSFQIFPKEFVCVLGPSGCGKSTLLKILAGFLPATSGLASIGGVPITGTDWHRGVVFQQPPLYEWFTVRKNVAFGPTMRKLPKAKVNELVEEYLHIVGLEEFGEKKIYELSGGMRQRVAIARALINDPEILLMDEPFGALDAMTRESMQSELRRIWWETGKTIFFITHDVDEALSLGTKILVMSKRPATIISEAKADYTMQYLENEDCNVRYKSDFFKEREKLLHLIQH